MPVEPSPTARALLDYARRGALTAVALGEGTLTFDGGKMVDAKGVDSGFLAFLVRAELLTPRDAREFSNSEDDATLNALREKLGGAVLRRARRAAWIDRLVRALGSGAKPVPATLGPVASVLPAEPFVPLLLDALARLAADREAGIVGAHADLHFVWSDRGTPQEIADARRWLTYDPPTDAPLSRLLVRHPGAAPRLAALVRAGFAQLLSAKEAAEQPTPSLPNLGRTSLAPARPPVRQLTPGATVPPAPVRRTTVNVPSFPPPTESPLEDPLFALESRITFLEAMNAPGPDRAEAWAASGDAWLRIHGALDEATRAYREAAAADPTDTAALLQAAQLCIATGRRQLARAYAASATAAASELLSGECRRLEARLALQDGDKARAANLLRDHVELDRDPSETWAMLALETGDPDLKTRATILLGRGESESSLEEERAKALRLVDSGHAEAAILSLTEAAEACDDVGLARALRLEAAEQAEAIGRPDLSFALLFDAFVRDSSLEILFEPLVEDAAAADEPALRAVLLERIGCITRGAAASTWLLRAAEAFAGLPGGREWSHELLIRALVAAPDSQSALAALTLAAEEARDANLLADGLERAAIRAPDDVAVALLEQLAGLAEKRLGSVHRAAWAWRMVHGRTGREDASREAVRLGDKAAVRSSLLRLAEEDLESAAEADRPSAVRRLAAMLRDHPEQRERAAKLYEEYLDAHPEDRTAAGALRRLVALAADPQSRLRALTRHMERAGGPRTEGLRLLEELCGLCAVLGEWERVRRYARDWLNMVPNDGIAAARLLMAATLRRDAPALHAATVARLRGRERLTHAPLLVRSADGEPPREALALYERALRIDPRCVPALLARAFVEAGTRADQWERTRAALEHAPSHPRLIERAIDLARTEAPEELNRLIQQGDAAGRKMRQSPQERYSSACEAGQGDRAEAALDAWLAGVSRPSGSKIVAGARVLGQTHPNEAVRLLVRATDQTSDPRLLRVAAEFETEDQTRALMLERKVIWEDQIEPHLHMLASIRRNMGHLASEARTLVRILAENPQDLNALRRLSDIYAESGEFERLYAVYGLQRKASESPRERRDASIAMATIAHRHLGEPARARAVLEELAVDAEGAATAAAVLAELGDTRGAIRLLERRAETIRRDAPPESERLILEAVGIAESVLNSPSEAIAISTRALTSGIRGANLMLTFERVTLKEQAREQACAVYDQLRGAAMGPHGRRGTTYRKARWLERLGDEEAALESYQLAFKDDPSDGVILSSIERLARRTGRLETWADALATLADKQTHIDHRLRYERRLVALLSIDLGDAQRAFDRLAVAWEESQKSELVADLRRLAHEIPDATAKDAALERITSGLRARIESTWNSDDQAATLGTLALVHLRDRRDEIATAQCLAELDKLMQEEPDIPRGLGAIAFAQVAEVLSATNGASAASHARRALHFDPNHPAALTIEREFGHLVVASSEKETKVERKVRAADTIVDPMSFADLQAELDVTPSDEAPSDEVPSDEAPSDEAPSDEAPSDEAPSDEAPSDEATSDEATSDEATSDEAPSDEAPSDEAPSDEVTSEETSTALDTRDDDEAERVASQPNRRIVVPKPVVRDSRPVIGRYGRSIRAPRTADAEAAAKVVPQAKAPAVDPLQAVPAPASVDADPPNTRAMTRASRWLRQPDPLPGEAELRARQQAGDLDAATSLGAMLAETAGRESEAVTLLVHALRQRPWRVDILRTLEGAARGARARGALSAATEYLAAIERAPRPSGVGAWRRSPSLGRARQLIWTDRHPFLDAMQLVWEDAASVFRVTHEALGVVGTERVTPLTYGPLGQAAAYVSDETSIFRAPGDGVRVGGTFPPCVLVGRYQDSEALPFLFASAAAQAHPRLVLLCAFPEQAQDHADAIYAAFGPASAAQEVGRQAATLMGELWRVVPARRQTALRDLVGGFGRPDVGLLNAEAAAAGARAGYLADGRLSDSLGFAGVEFDELHTTMKDNPAASAIVRLAFSDAVLVARAEAEES